MKKYLFLMQCIFFFNCTNSQTIKIWEQSPPSNNGLSGKELTKGTFISNISEPEITVYHPEGNNKTKAVIICPGGGYSGVAFEHEGTQVAEWLQSNGYTAILLKYRLPNKKKEIPLDDVQQTLKIVRSKAKEWNLIEDKIGIAGFSAGGHLVSTASTHFSTPETRPDFTILFYPVVSMGKYTHKGSLHNLLGDNPSEEDINAYSNETRVTEQTPPTLLLLSDNDSLVPSMNSILYYEALKRNNVPATMYIFPTGGHGWGMNKNFEYHDLMLSLLNSWLKSI